VCSKGEVVGSEEKVHTAGDCYNGVGIVVISSVACSLTAVAVIDSGVVTVGLSSRNIYLTTVFDTKDYASLFGSFVTSTKFFSSIFPAYL
jgi:hypothetical protein